MNFLGKPHGCFKLNDSDNFIGSYISANDLSEILNVSVEDLSEINFVKKNGELYTLWRSDKLRQFCSDKLRR